MEPMLPTTIGPEFTPTRAAGFIVYCVSASFRRAISTWQSTAASRASFLCSAWSSGAFQKATMQSPMYLSTVPSCFRMISVKAERYSLSMVVSSSGVIFSDMVVKPARSRKKAVMSRFSPPRESLDGSLVMISTTLGDRYCPKVFFIHFFSRLSISALCTVT